MFCFFTISADNNCTACKHPMTYEAIIDNYCRAEFGELCPLAIFLFFSILLFSFGVAVSFLFFHFSLHIISWKSSLTMCPSLNSLVVVVLSASGFSISFFFFVFSSVVWFWLITLLPTKSHTVLSFFVSVRVLFSWCASMWFKTSSAEVPFLTLLFLCVEKKVNKQRELIALDQVTSPVQQAHNNTHLLTRVTTTDRAPLLPFVHWLCRSALGLIHFQST